MTLDKQHVDILTARFVRQRQRFDVVDGATCLATSCRPLGPAPALAGTIGQTLNPERRFPSLFEPVHGSAPDIYRRNIANPVAMIWSGALMLDFLTEGEGCRARGA